MNTHHCNDVRNPIDKFKISRLEISSLPNFYPKVSVILKPNTQRTEFKTECKEQQILITNALADDHVASDDEDDDLTNEEHFRRGFFYLLDYVTSTDIFQIGDRKKRPHLS